MERGRKRPWDAASTIARQGPTNPVAHRVDDDVDGDLDGVGRVAQRVVRALGPLPRVADVGVPVDDDHQPAVVIEDPLDLRLVAVPLPRRAALRVADRGDLHDLLDVVHRVEDGVIERDVDDRVLRQHAADLGLEVRPFPGPPEIVDHEEPAREQVVAEPLGLRLAHVHVPDLESVEEREPAHVGVVEPDRVLCLVGVEVDEPLEDDQELAVGLGVVGGPGAPAVAAVVDGPGEEELAGIGVEVAARRPPDVAPPEDRLPLRGRRPRGAPGHAREAGRRESSSRRPQGLGNGGRRRPPRGGAGHAREAGRRGSCRRRHESLGNDGRQAGRLGADRRRQAPGRPQGSPPDGDHGRRHHSGTREYR